MNSNLHSTDIDRDFKDFDNNREFAKEVLVSMFVSFVVGMIIATAIIAALLSIAG